MWRSVKLVAVKTKIHQKGVHRFYSNESRLNKYGKIAFVLAATGAGLVSAVVYSKYDSKLRNIFQKNIPYFDKIYKLLLELRESISLTPTVSVDDKREAKMPSSLLKEEILGDAKKSSKFEKLGVESKASNQKTSHNINESDGKSAAQISSLSKVSELTFIENVLADMMKQLNSSCDETKSAYENAVKAIRKQIKIIYEALNTLEDSDNSIIFKRAEQEINDKNTAVKNAQEKASSTKAFVEKLNMNVRIIAAEDPQHPLIKMCEDIVKKVTNELKYLETDIKSAEKETAAEYQKLINKSEELKQKLQAVLPNHFYSLNDKDIITKSDLNILIALAHQKIEQLQKQLAMQQVTENIRVDEVLRNQLKKNSATEVEIKAELDKRSIEIENSVAKRVASLKENFELELQKLLHYQTLAHLDHIREILKVHEQELERKYSLDLEEKMLHMKSVFTSELSDLIARLNKILSFLKTKAELDVKSKKARSLWLSCQSVREKISSNACHLSPLVDDIASIKLSADESNVFVETVLKKIPSEALTRGVYSPEVLKQKFFYVNKMCQKVALIDENNDSLYHYLLSYLQSYLIIDMGEASMPKAELEGKMAVDPSEWDTYDILARISYSLKTDNLEQALRYANQLKGEARVVAKDWMNELRLFLETQISIKALAAHAAAINVQAYH